MSEYTFGPDECYERTGHCFLPPGGIMAGDDVAGVCRHCGVVRRLTEYFTMPGTDGDYRGEDMHIYSTDFAVYSTRWVPPEKRKAATYRD